MNGAANVERVLPARAAAGRRSRLMTGDGAALTGATAPTLTLDTALEGGLVPATDGRRPPVVAEHQRPARQAAADQGQGRRHRAGRRPTGPTSARRRVHDPGRATCSRSPAERREKTRPEVYAMGFRNPFRDPGRRERRRVHQRLLAGRGRSAAVARTGGHRPVHDRAAAGQLRLADSASRRTSATTRWNFHEFGLAVLTRRTAPTGRASARRARRSTSSATARRSATTRAGTSRAGPSIEPGLQVVPFPVTNPEIWYSNMDNDPDDPARDAVLRLLRDDARADRAGLDDRVPAAVPGAVRGRRRPARRARSTTYDPNNPNPKKFPPYYDDAVILGEFARGHDARGQARRPEPRVQDQQLPGLRTGRREPDVPVRVRQPDGHAVGRGRRVLPAHVRRRVLQHQPGRRHVPLGVRRRASGAPNGP